MSVSFPNLAVTLGAIALVAGAALAGAWYGSQPFLMGGEPTDLPAGEILMIGAPPSSCPCNHFVVVRPQALTDEVSKGLRP